MPFFACTRPISLSSHISHHDTEHIAVIEVSVFTVLHHRIEVLSLGIGKSLTVVEHTRQMSLPLHAEVISYVLTASVYPRCAHCLIRRSQQSVRDTLQHRVFQFGAIRFQLLHILHKGLRILVSLLLHVLHPLLEVRERVLGFLCPRNRMEGRQHDAEPENCNKSFVHSLYRSVLSE